VIAEGMEWQARELAAAADEEMLRFREMGSNARRAAYCQGVRDGLRLTTGDLSPEDGPAELVNIYHRYLDGI
jgi:hypothetical protein